MKSIEILNHILELPEEDFKILATNLAEHKILLHDGLFIGPGDGPYDTHFHPLVEEEEEEKVYSLKLFSSNDLKSVIKLLMSSFNLNLREAKMVYDSMPCVIYEDKFLSLVESYKKQFENIDCIVEIF